MKPSHFLGLGCIASLSIALTTYAIGSKPPIVPWATNQSVADLLGWQTNTDSVCKGYFVQPPFVANYPNPGPIDQLPFDMTATGPALLEADGRSVLHDNVRFTQQGRLATADQAVLERHNQQVDIIHLSGHAQLEESGYTVVGPYGTLDVANSALHWGPGLYRAYQPTGTMHSPSPFDAWGSTTQFDRGADQVVHLKNATYSTCNPTHPTWYLSAKTIDLDKVNGDGVARHAIIRFEDVPILYAPYFDFPLDKRRKSGLLNPTVGYTSNNGFDTTIPYYFNLAPNYDLQLIPRIMTLRGLQMNGLFRYLTTDHTGNIYASDIPYDFEFNRFRDDSANNAQGNDNIDPHYISELDNDSDNRYYLHWEDKANYNNHWSSDLHLNYVSDDYYFKDFGNQYSDVSANQLLNDASVSYDNTHWNVNLLTEVYQTLHLIDQFNDPPVSQYERLPELDLDGYYGNIKPHIDFDVNAQVVNFDYQSDFDPTTDQQPIGQRLHLMPNFSFPFNSLAAYSTPQIALDTTSYVVQEAIPDGMSNRPSLTDTRVLPIFDVDNGLYFDRTVQGDSQSYIQTLEPRLFYLYVPYQQQDELPNFDTQLLAFSYPQLFALNRFSGYDRLENANQVSLGLTSRLLTATDSRTLLEADIGGGYYFQKPKVCLDPQCDDPGEINLNDSNLSPLTSRVTYNPVPSWSTEADYTWNPAAHETDNAKLALLYQRDPKREATVGYQFVKELSGDPTDSLGLSNNTNQMYGGVAWPLTEQWSALSYLFYNLSKERPNSYYAGVQYEDCCWAIRFIGSRSFSSVDTDSTSNNIINNYKTAFFMQIQLKGFANFSNSSTQGLLAPFQGLENIF